VFLSAISFSFSARANSLMQIFLILSAEYFGARAQALSRSARHALDAALRQSRECRKLRATTPYLSIAREACETTSGVRLRTPQRSAY
jgi:hypothetical protein